MGIIRVEDIRCYAFHGCMDEEEIIGTDFTVSVEVQADLSVSAKSDKLSETIDYVSISKIVQDEMAKRSKLIEHVAQRILDRMMLEFPSIEKSKVLVVKHNAPIQGDVLRVCVELDAQR
ncbi:MAG: dihydroneopterin aldolase [Flavobacteriales bacterium]|nr:dihydroneopterin aldolase [Flavobacteriales bacterium]